MEQQTESIISQSKTVTNSSQEKLLMNGDIKIGKLLCDEDIITRRQLNQALQVQVKGDKRSLGEILVAKGFCTLDDITEVIMQSDSKNGHEKHQEVIAEKIEPKEEPQEEVKELSEDTKFSMSVGTMIGIGTAIASVVGVYYMLVYFYDYKV